MTDPRVMTERLREFREQVVGAVGIDGPDAHQVEIDALVWGYAYVEAARALRAWADVTGDALASEMAAAAEVEARGVLDGSPLEASAALGVRYASIAAALRPVEGLGDSSERRLLRSTLRSFADREIRPQAQRIHRQDDDVPEAVIGGLAKLGLFGLSVPVEYGGSRDADQDLRGVLVATEELSRASLSAGGSIVTRAEILVRALLTGGTAEQRRRWLPPIAGGDALVAIAVTEPDVGSDIANLRCRATRAADGSGSWEITGSKLWSTFAGRAELLAILCRTGESGHKGLSLFVAEKPAFPGHAFEDLQPAGGSLRGRAIPTIGYRGMHTFELAFDRYRLPQISLVGGDDWLDRGFYLQLEGFTLGRLQTAGRAVGVMQAALDLAVVYAQQRSIFGRKEIDFQLVRAKIGAMAVRVAASRQLSYAAAALLEQGRGQVEASLAKLYASRMAELVTREAMQLHGAMGYGEESDVSRLFLDARVLAIFEGAEEVLSLRVIGRSLLDGE